MKEGLFLGVLLNHGRVESIDETSEGCLPWLFKKIIL